MAVTSLLYIVIGLLALVLRADMAEKRRGEIHKRQHIEQHIERHNVGERKLPDEDLQALIWTRNASYLLHGWFKVADPLLVGTFLYMMYRAFFG